MPDLLTFPELGVPRLDTSGWFGSLAPAGTPRAIVEKIAADTCAGAGLPRDRRQPARVGLEPTRPRPEAFARFLRVEDLVR